MSEMKSLTLNGMTYDSFVDKTARNYPVTSVNGKIGAISLTAADVGALREDQLQRGIDAALAQAKSSGEFDGYTPVKGTDYFTEADKQELVNAVLAALPAWTGGSY